MLKLAQTALRILPYVYIFVLGLCVGSFLNVCIYRMPRGISVAVPASHCPHCGHTLRMSELVPVLSYLFLRGKCRHCRVAISPRYLLIELATAALWLYILVHFGLGIRFLSAILLASILLCAAVIDVEHTIIPNSLVLFGTLTGGVLALFPTTVNLFNALLGMLMGALPLLAIDMISRYTIKKEGMGGGDVKLMGMVGLYLGWQATLLALVMAFVLGGLMGIGVMLTNRSKRNIYIPFAPALCIASLISMLYYTQISTWYLQLLGV